VWLSCQHAADVMAPTSIASDSNSGAPRGWAQTTAAGYPTSTRSSSSGIAYGRAVGNVWVANWQIVARTGLPAQACRDWRSCYRSTYARSAAPRDSPVRNRYETPPPRWRPRSRSGIIVAQAADHHQQSLSPPRPASDDDRSLRARTDLPIHQSTPDSEAFRDPQANHVILAGRPRRPGPKGPAAQLWCANTRSVRMSSRYYGVQTKSGANKYS
jgi:hypothetical protein